MTQVLRGADDRRGDDGRAPARRPPPRAARLPPAGLVLRGAAARRSPWPWILGLLALAIAGGGGYLLYEKVQDQLNAEPAGGGASTSAQIQYTLAKQQLEAQGFHVARDRASRATPSPSALVISQDPAGGRPRSRRARRSRSPSRPAAPKSTVPDVRGPDADQTRSRRSCNAGPEARTGHYVYSTEPQRHRDRVRARRRDGRAQRLEGADQRLAGREAGRRAERRRPAVRERRERAQGAGLQGRARRRRLRRSRRAPSIAQDPAAGASVAQRLDGDASPSRRARRRPQVPNVTGDDAGRRASSCSSDAGFKSTVDDAGRHRPEPGRPRARAGSGRRARLEQGSTRDAHRRHSSSTAPPPTTPPTRRRRPRRRPRPRRRRHDHDADHDAPPTPRTTDPTSPHSLRRRDRGAVGRPLERARDLASPRRGASRRRSPGSAWRCPRRDRPRRRVGARPAGQRRLPELARRRA